MAKIVQAVTIRNDGTESILVTEYYHEDRQRLTTKKTVVARGDSMAVEVSETKGFYVDKASEEEKSADVADLPASDRA